MARAKANGIEIEYETAGNKGDPAVLLIMGLGAQLTIWPDALVEGLAKKGFFVVRFDNRDTGLTTDFGPWGVPNIAEAIGKVMMGKKVDAPYLVKDMAGDGIGLLDALGIDKSWVVLRSIENGEHDRCVDLFRRPDGSFGFDEFRRDVEDAGAWTPVAYHSGAAYSSMDDDMSAAVKAVAWLDGALKDR